LLRVALIPLTSAGAESVATGTARAVRPGSKSPSDMRKSAEADCHNVRHPHWQAVQYVRPHGDNSSPDALCAIGNEVVGRDAVR